MCGSMAAMETIGTLTIEYGTQAGYGLNASMGTTDKPVGCQGTHVPICTKPPAYGETRITPQDMELPTEAASMSSLAT